MGTTTITTWRLDPLGVVSAGVPNSGAHDRCQCRPCGCLCLEHPSTISIYGQHHGHHDAPAVTSNLYMWRGETRPPSLCGPDKKVSSRLFRWNVYFKFNILNALAGCPPPVSLPGLPYESLLKVRVPVTNVTCRLSLCRLCGVACLSRG